MKNEKQKVVVINEVSRLNGADIKQIEKILEGEVCSSLGPIEVKQTSDEVKEIFILQKVEHVDPEILRRELRNDAPWKTQKWRKKLK